MSFTLIEESECATNPVRINRLSDAEVELVLEGIERLDVYCNGPSEVGYLLASIDDIKGSIFSVRENEVKPFLSVLDGLGMGYRVYKSLTPHIFIANSTERFDAIPMMEENEYENFADAEEGTLGYFLGLENPRDRSWWDDAPELYQQNKDGVKLDDLVGQDLSERELLDLSVCSVTFRPTAEGLKRMIQYGRDIRSACERFDIVSSSVAGSLSFLEIAHQYGFCNQPSYEVVQAYFETRRQIGIANGWRFTEQINVEDDFDPVNTFGWSVYNLNDS